MQCLLCVCTSEACYMRAARTSPSREDHRHPSPFVIARTSLLNFLTVFPTRAGDLMHIKLFGMHIIIICNYDTASALMSQASYSDRPILTMVGDLYVALSHTFCLTVWAGMEPR